MKRKMVIVYKMGNSYVVKTYKKFTYTEIVKGLIAGLSSFVKQITEDNFCKLFSEKNYLQNNIVFDKQNNIIAFQLVEHDNTFSYWELIKDER